MTPEQVLRTYDEDYASRYDAMYLFRKDERLDEKTGFELGLLRDLTQSVASWLDVACGTGFFLANACANPAARRCGLDLSPAMLTLAKKANPGVTFIQADYRDPQPTLENSWELTTCLWGAYSLQETVEDVEALVRNLAAWTRADGTCLMPAFDPRSLRKRREDGRLGSRMWVNEDGTRWSYDAPGSKRHDNLISPPLSVMETMFRRHFNDVEFFSYPKDVDGGGLVGLIARTPLGR